MGPGTSRCRILSPRSHPRSDNHSASSSSGDWLVFLVHNLTVYRIESRSKAWYTAVAHFGSRVRLPRFESQLCAEQQGGLEESLCPSEDSNSFDEDEMTEM